MEGGRGGKVEGTISDGGGDRKSGVSGYLGTSVGSKS